MHRSTLASSSRLLTRRRLLQVGGLGMVGLGLPRLLQARARSMSAELGDGPAKACIFIVQGGGPSQLDIWDMKPHAAAEYRGPYQPIATSMPGFRVCELMPRLAKLANRYCVIRSMTHTHADHGAAMHAFLGGHAQPAPDAPYFGSVAAKLRPSTRNVPSYVWLQDLEGDSGVGSRYLTGGALGAAYAPLRVGQGADNPTSQNFRVKAFDGPTNVPAERVVGRRDLLSQLDATDSVIGQTTAGGGMTRLREKAFDLITGPEARRAFDISREPGAVRERYGQHYLGQNLLLARRLIEAGVRLVSVTAFCGPSPYPSEVKYGVVANMWDMHGNGGNIYGKGWNGLGWALPCWDQALSALLEDLDQRGLLESTLVVSLGEMGRTPKIATRSPVVSGRDHWPHCYTAFLAGGGIRGGTTYGASDRIAAYPKDNPVSPQDFSATVYQALGIPADTRLGADGFSKPVSAGRAIGELFG
jgi:hypothetical protein